jgi:DNA-binding NtrC family response regulator
MSASGTPEELEGSVLLVTSDDRYESSLRAIIEGSLHTTHRALNCFQALLCLQDHDVAVVVAEADLPDGNWKNLLDIASNRPDPPQLIVFSRRADDMLWAEVLNLGGYDVLPTPFAAEEVLRTISLACDARARRPVRGTPLKVGGPNHSAVAA